MVKIKITTLSVTSLLLFIICIYQFYKLETIRNNYQYTKEKINEVYNLKKEIGKNIFLKSKKQLFKINSKLKKDVQNICDSINIKEIKFKQNNQNTFLLQLNTCDERIIYKLIYKIKTELGGIITLNNLKISLKPNNQINTIMEFRIYYPPKNLEKFIHIKKYSQQKLMNIFPKTFHNIYQLNGINHYDTAYINGRPFNVGQHIGEYKIHKIYDSFILLQKEKQIQKILLDDKWK